MNIFVERLSVTAVKLETTESNLKVIAKESNQHKIEENTNNRCKAPLTINKTKSGGLQMWDIEQLIENPCR